MQGDDKSVDLRVLLVEDCEDDALLVLREMRRGGFSPAHRRVDTLEGLNDALQQGGWDVLICDYRLPGFSALDVLAEVRRRGVDLPVLVVSGAIGEDLAVETMHAGAHDFIMKDRLARLNPAIDRELREIEEHRQRARAEAALRQSEEHFRQLAGNIEGVLWLIDSDQQRMIYVNPGYERIWEHSAHHLFESLEAFLETIHPEDYARVEETLERRGWAGFNEEYRIQLPDESERWVSTRSFPIRDDDGRIYRAAGLSSDITERKRLETEREKLLRALEQTADMVMITNREGIIEYVNAAFEDTTGFRREEAVGHRPDILSSGLMEHEFYSRMWQSLINGLPFTELFINRRKDGDLYYEAKTITPVRDERGDVTHFVSTGKDVTRRLGKQENLERVLNHDAATGLATRALLVDRIDRALLRAQTAGGRVGLLCIGLGLEALLGAEQAERLAAPLLLEVVARLDAALECPHSFGRIGHDVLGVLVTGDTDIEALGDAVSAALAVPVSAEGYQLHLGPGIGVSVFPDDSDNTDAVVRHAEQAMEHSRKHGRGKFTFYSGELSGSEPSRLPC